MNLRNVALAVAILTIGTACGVRVQDRPERIEHRDVPFGLLEPSDGEERVTFVVYLFSGDEMIGVPRVGPGPLTPEVAVNALLHGPTPQEVTAGLRSAVPPGTTLLDVSREGDAATLDLSAAILRAENLAAAHRQLTATVRLLPGINTVRLTAEGAAVEIPGGAPEAATR